MNALTAVALVHHCSRLAADLAPGQFPQRPVERLRQRDRERELGRLARPAMRPCHPRGRFGVPVVAVCDDA